MELKIVDDNKLDISTKNEIDICITKYIDQHKGNAREINNLTIESVTSLTTANARFAELKDQKCLKRVFNNLTGKNQKLHAQGNMDLISAQYAQQQILTNLAKQNLITFDLAITINNKLNMLAEEFDNEINNIYKILIQFFKSIQSDIVKLSDDVESLKKNDKLSDWTLDIEYLMLGDKNYYELGDIEKVVCVVRDFYDLTEGSAHYSNIRRLKTIFSTLNVDFNLGMVTCFEFITALTSNPLLYDKLLGSASPILDYSDCYYATYIKGLSKYLALGKDEKYLVESVCEITNVDDFDRVRNTVFDKFMKFRGFIDIYKPIRIIDFACELLLNLRQIYSPPIEAVDDSLPMEQIEKDPFEVIKEQYKSLAKEIYTNHISTKHIESALVFEALQIIPLTDDCYADGIMGGEKIVFIEFLELNTIYGYKIQYKTIWRGEIVTTSNQFLSDEFRKNASKCGVKSVVMLENRPDSSKHDVYLIPISKINIVKKIEKYLYGNISPWFELYKADSDSNAMAKRSEDKVQ